MRRPLVVVLFGIGILLLGTPALAQTPDSFTPAVEEACTKYEGEGARHGLCIAYCEAQDCDNTKGFNPSCAAIDDRFIAYSVRQGYIKKPLGEGKSVIACKVTACTAQDAKLCGGREADCERGGVCEPVCTRIFEGFGQTGEAMCTFTKCATCVGEKPEG